MNTITSPAAVCANFSKDSQKLTVRMLEEGMVLFEGGAEALEFVGSRLIAQARFEKDCGFQLSPDGAGSAVFSPESSFGLYIHRTPCTHGDES